MALSEPSPICRPLPRNPTVSQTGRPVWQLENGPLPLDRHRADHEVSSSRIEGGRIVSRSIATDVCEKTLETCCKAVQDESDRHLISPEIVRDIIIGLSDGLTVPFALTAGLSSLGSSRLVVTAGLAELCAGAISMGVGGYLASRAELDHYRYLRRRTAARVLRSCSAELEREVQSILVPLGVTSNLSRLITEHFLATQNSIPGGTMITPDTAEGIETGHTATRTLQSEPRLQGRDVCQETGENAGDLEQGLTPFLLRFGEGLEEAPKSRLYISALTIGFSYFIGGLIPLIPYFATKRADIGLYISVGLTVLVLLVFGAFKTYFTGARGGLGGYVYGAVSTAVVGGLAAGAAFGLVKAMHIKE